MGVYNQTKDNVFADDAEWRTFCLAIENALLASGFLVRTADTGQLDLEGSAARPAVGTFAGFRMYKANDAIAATRPFYIRFEYGVGNAVDRIKTQYTMGVGSNGAGVLSAPTKSAVAGPSASAIGSGLARIFGGGNDHMAWVCISDPGISSQGGFHSFGRLLHQDDGDGSDQIIWSSVTAAQTSFLFTAFDWSTGSSAWAATSGATFFAPDLSLAIHNGGDISTSLLFQALVYRNAETLVFPFLIGLTTELPYTDPDSSVISLDVWGATRNFVPIPQGAGSASSVRAIVPYEA